MIDAMWLVSAVLVLLMAFCFFLMVHFQQRKSIAVVCVLLVGVVFLLVSL